MPSVASSSSSRPASAASRRAQKSPVIGPSKYECAARSKVVSQKRRRIPLATAFDGNAHVDTTPKVTLPRTLARPEWVPDEVDTESLCRVYPNLTGVPVEYIRDNLPLEELCAAIKDAHTFQPQNHDELPTELEIFMTDAIANNRPTHVLAVHNGSPDSSADEKCAVSLFPIHELLFRVSCAHLPPLPGARLEPSFLWYTTVPVVPIRLPSVETFPLLRTYLYTQDAAKLFTSLAPPCEPDLHQLAQHARKIHDFWSNACTLGVVDQRVYDVIEVSWERTIEAMQACS